MTTAFVLGGGGLLGAHEVGHAARAVRSQDHARTSRGHLDRGDQRRVCCRRPGWVSRTARPNVARRRAGASLQRDRLRPGRPAGALRHAPALPRAAGRVAGRFAARRATSPTWRCPSSAWPPASRRASAGLVQQWAGRAGRHGLVRCARAAAAGRDRRRALFRRRPGRLHPGRTRRRARAPPPSTCCRWAGSRAPLSVAETPMGGRPNRVRDRPSAPFP